MGKRRVEEMTMKDWEQPDKLEDLEKIASEGKTLAQIANFMRISRKTLYFWRKESELIRNAIKTGEDDAIDKAEQTLYSMGVDDRNIAALIFLLKNKRPNKWKDKRDTEISGAGGKLAIEWGKDEDKAK